MRRVTDPTEAAAPPRLVARDLSLRYGPTRVIEALNLSLPAGAITTIVGANGSGKSTLLRALARLLRPEGGQVLLAGRDLHSLPAAELARALSILPQSPAAPEGLTVEELVWFGRHPHQGPFGARRAGDREAVAAALDQTGMTVFASRPVDRLSGGQRQRAWIALCLAQGANTLLLDEPTTYLDLSHQLEVLELLGRLRREGGKTVVMVLHDLNQAVRYSDHLVALRGGAVYRQGPAAEVMTHELLRDVFGLRAHLLSDPDTGRPHIIPSGIARGGEGR